MSAKRVDAAEGQQFAHMSAFGNNYPGGVRVDNISYGQDNPQQRQEDSFAKARYWFRYNLFLRQILLLKLGFFNFGCSFLGKDGKLVPVDLVAGGAAANGEPNVGLARSRSGGLAAWLGENQREVNRYIREAWLEWLQLDNVICLWRKAGGRPLVYPPESCEYTDKFGVEKLVVQHGLTQEEIKELSGFGLGTDLRNMFSAGGKWVITHQHPVFDFDVVKRERVGHGLSWPGLATLFQTLAQNEGMEVGDSILGNMLRTPIEQHKIGHETRYGPMAGGKQNFVTKPKAKAVEDNLKGKVGHIRLATGHDHSINFVLPDPKQFDPKRYEGVFKRLEAWGMPLTQMVFARGLNPYLMQVLAEQARVERRELRPHFERVFTETLKMPKGTSVVWSDRCFRDSKLWADLLKFGLSSGPLSQETFIEEAGYSTEEERERKASEKKLGEDKTHPIYDAAHGKPDAGKGRKRGTSDGQGES